MNAVTRQEKYRRRVLLKAKLYDRIVKELGPLRKSHDEIDQILSEAKDLEGDKGLPE